MKNVRTTLTIALALCVLCCVLTATAETFDRGDYYPRLALVVGVEDTEEEQTVTCLDLSGNLWQFYADSQAWSVGDLVNLLMQNNGGQVEDDEIVEVYFEKHFSFTDAVRWMDDIYAGE
jgi:hypothetical protein